MGASTRKCIYSIAFQLQHEIHIIRGPIPAQQDIVKVYIYSLIIYSIDLN